MDLNIKKKEESFSLKISARFLVAIGTMTSIILSAIVTAIIML
ncbi:hypothetical protein [Priestia megaterium]